MNQCGPWPQPSSAITTLSEEVVQTELHLPATMMSTLYQETSICKLHKWRSLTKFLHKQCVSSPRLESSAA